MTDYQIVYGDLVLKSDSAEGAIALYREVTAGVENRQAARNVVNGRHSHTANAKRAAGQSQSWGPPKKLEKERGIPASLGRKLFSRIKTLHPEIKNNPEELEQLLNGVLDEKFAGHPTKTPVEIAELLLNEEVSNHSLQP